MIPPPPLSHHLYLAQRANPPLADIQVVGLFLKEILPFLSSEEHDEETMKKRQKKEVVG